MRDRESEKTARFNAMLRQRAEAMVRASPADVGEMTQNEIQHLVYELQVHQVELELQNKELREAQLELASSRDRLSDLYEFAPIGYLTLDSHGMVIDANLTAATMLGTDRDSLTRSKFSDYVAPASQDAAYLYWQKVFSTGGKQLADLELQRAGGESMIARLESVAFASPTPPKSQSRVALIDTTDLKHAQESVVALNANLEQQVNAQVEELKLLANALAELSEGVLITTDHQDWPGSRVVYANEAMSRFIGRALEEMRDQSPQRQLEELIDSAALAQVKDQVSATGSYQGELAYARRDGRTGEIELLISPLLDYNKVRSYFVSVQRDITERKRVELAVLERKERLQAVLDAALDAIITIDQQGIIQDCNLAVERIFGYPSAEIVGRNINLLMPDPHREQHDNYFRRYLETQKARIIGTNQDLRALHRDGHSFPITLSVSEVDHLGLYTGVIHDASELRKLQRELLRAVGEEQWRIGQALHDGPQQTLAGLSLLARGLALDLSQNDSPHTAEATRLSEGLAEANKIIRSLGRGLVPVRIGSGGLVAALQHLARQTSEDYDLDCDFQCPEPIDIRDNYTVDQLYLIAQEATLNAVKHSAADRICISLGWQGHAISLKVVDNGSGIQAAEPGNRGLGMHIMPYRASTIGASLTVSDAAGGGTVVDCTLGNIVSSRFTVQAAGR